MDSVEIIGEVFFGSSRICRGFGVYMVAIERFSKFGSLFGFCFLFIFRDFFVWMKRVLVVIELELIFS